MAAPTGNAAFLLLLSACCAATLACDPSSRPPLPATRVRGIRSSSSSVVEVIPLQYFMVTDVWSRSNTSVTQSHSEVLQRILSGGAKFGYVGSVGPDHWGALSPNFTACAVGTNQSPIDIATAAAVCNPALQPLRRGYTVANGTLVDNVFNIAVRFDAGGGNVTVGGKQYRLKQMHWHSPSEHTVDGQRFPVELHMVHANDDGNVTVVAMLYRFGRPDPFFSQLQDKLAALSAEGCDAEKGAPVPAGVVSLWPLRLRSHTYYRYVGSFTTPPCTENVVWSILAQVREMSVDQAAALTAPLEQDYRRNNRPTQPMNGRVVQVYRAAGP